MNTLNDYVFRAIQPVLHIGWIVRKAQPPPHIVKAKKIRELQKMSGYTTFVETGTYKGDMIESQKNNFSTIFSIELGDALAKRAIKRFSDEPHVHIYRGDSARILPKILAKIHEPCIFWLDAHFSGGMTVKNESNTPIISELQAILQSARYAHIILIDDAHLFTGENDYPTVVKIKTLMNKYRRGARLYKENDMLLIYLT